MPWMSSGEVAERLGVTDKTVRRFVAMGILSPVRFGARGQYRYDSLEVERVLERARVRGTSEEAVEPAEGSGGPEEARADVASSARATVPA
jgi:excisionase family DNA binding protein